MKHYLLLKLKDGVVSEQYANDIRPLFERVVAETDGVEGCNVLVNTVARPNNYDVMVTLMLSQCGLDNYVNSPLHKDFKANYLNDVEKKAVFDD